MADEAAPLDYDDVARRGAAAGLRRGRSGGRRRGPRRGQQAGHPRPAGVRRVARPGGHRDAGRRRRRRRRPARASRASASPTRPMRGGAGPDHPAARDRDAVDDDGRRSPRPSCRPRSGSTSPLGRTAGVRNRIEVDARAGRARSASTVPGAGGAGDASAVLGDLIAVAREAGSTWGPRRAGRPSPHRRSPWPRPAERASSTTAARRPVSDR